MPPYFFNKTLRNLIVGFQTLFNNVTIKRYDDEGNVVKEIPVPLKFGPMHKYYMRRMEDGSMKRYYVQLPTMAVTIGGFSFSQERARAMKERRYMIDPNSYNDPNAFLSDLMPSPWDVSFKLDIRTESFMDWMQIVEQIIPFFNPSVYLRMKEFNTINLERDIRVTLNSMSPEFMEEQDEDSVRSINGSLDFTVDAWFYRPITDANIIKTIHTKYGFDPAADMFEYYNTSALPLSSTIDFVTSGTITTGYVDIKTGNVNSSATSAEYGYVNLMPE